MRMAGSALEIRRRPPSPPIPATPVEANAPAAALTRGGNIGEVVTGGISLDVGTPPPRENPPSLPLNWTGGIGTCGCVGMRSARLSGLPCPYTVMARLKESRPVLLDADAGRTNGPLPRIRAGDVDGDTASATAPLSKKVGLYVRCLEAAVKRATPPPSPTPPAMPPW